MMKAEDIMTEAQKREARKALRNWVDNELCYMLSEEVKQEAERQLKKMKPDLQALVIQQLSNKLPKIAKQIVDRLYIEVQGY